VIRGALVLVLAAALAVAASAMIGQPGRASIEWFGWRLDMTAAAAVMLVVLGALVATAFWRTVLWVAQAPARAARARAMARRRQANDALTRGFLAAAAQDGAEARRWAARAGELVEDAPALVRVLAAQAAEAAGDHAAAQAAYTAMLSFPEMKLAGHRGLMQLALAKGDKAAALTHAEAAYASGRPARWAWTALLQARLDEADWAGALELVKGAGERKIVPPLVADRTRAALLAALAAEHESGPDPKARSQALDDALEAARLKPGFAPATAIAARLLAADGKGSRAAGLIEAAWKAAPHPALWLAWRDLETQETPLRRAARLKALAELKPDNRESRLLMIEQALIAGDAAAARRAAAPFLLEAPTARTCALMARLAFAAGEPDEARAWIARAAGAPQEADWSDIDPDGRAFPYGPGDWARLVARYAEAGELIHPRLERAERTISELPELPLGYQASAPFLRAAEAGAALGPLPDDPGPPEPDPETASAGPPVTGPGSPARPRPRLGGGARGRRR
jgi:HemY protein